MFVQNVWVQFAEGYSYGAPNSMGEDGARTGSQDWDTIPPIDTNQTKQ